jgi:hypothetical protein
MNTNITEASLKLFLTYADDAGNWGGTPWVCEGNHQLTAEQRGNLTQLKKAGLLRTVGEGRDAYIEFTVAGKALAAEHNIEID